MLANPAKSLHHQDRKKGYPTRARPSGVSAEIVIDEFFHLGTLGTMTIHLKQEGLLQL